MFVGSCHSHDPNFFVKCGVNNCTSSYTNYNSFRKHLIRKHPEVVKGRRDESPSHGNGERESGTDSQGDDDGTTTGCNKGMENAHQRALFLLKAKEVHKMSEQALSDVMAVFTVLIDGILDDEYEEIEKKLTATETSLNDIGLRDVFNSKKFKDPFQGLNSDYLHSKYYIQHMSLVVCSCNGMVAFVSVISYM